MADTHLSGRVVSDAAICGGRPCILGTRIEIAMILDSMAEGMTAETIIEHFPQLTPDDIRAAIAYAAEISRESVWKAAPRP